MLGVYLTQPNQNKDEKMSIDTNFKAKRVWEQQIKGKKAFDREGREIHKRCYGLEWSAYCWNIDHIITKSKGGWSKLDNLQAVHILTNREKGNFIHNVTRLRQVHTHVKLFANLHKESKKQGKGKKAE